MSSERRSVLVAYGSETGNAQEIAEELGRVCKRLRFSVEVTDLNSISLNDLLKHTCVVISISTTGQGGLPANAQTFWKKLRSTRLLAGCLKNLQFTSFGLGDSSYPQFNYAHRKLSNRLIQLGAQTVFGRGEADEQHSEGVEGLFLSWSTHFKKRLLEIFPLPGGIEPVPDDQFVEPDWLLKLREPQTNGHRNHADASQVSRSTEVGSATPSKGVRHSQTLPATLTCNNRVTAQTHWQDVRLIDFTLPATTYSPGDVLTIHPHNHPDDVNTLIDLMSWTSIADEPLTLTPSFPSTAAHPPKFLSSMSQLLTLRNLLTSVLDITAIPKRSFLSAMSHFAADDSHKERLQEFTSPDLIDELYDYTTRPRRSILEVLQEFDSVKFPFQCVLGVFSFIRGRQFSIASGGRLKEAEEGMTKVQLLVAIVKYKTVIRRVRRGLCTRYLASLEEGAHLQVELVKGAMKVFTEKPAITIGPGTGVAPLRSMIYEREMIGIMEKQVLFFGCRNRDSDYFFKHEWEEFESEKKLEVWVAGSREQKEKVYVQDLIQKQGSMVRDMLMNRGAVVYVCGSSGKMPQAVRAAILDALQTKSEPEIKVEGQDTAIFKELTSEEAETFLRSLEKNGRYQQETW